MSKTNQEQLLRYIDEVSFAINDIVLFLDTHPCNACAMEYYHKYKELREQALKEYTACYGPLLNYDAPCTDTWIWAKQPWPWEKEGVC